MRIFKKACQKEGFLIDIKRASSYYSKPSEKKRRSGTIKKVF